MAIRLPTERAYYLASAGEPDRLLCWIPREELEAMVEADEADSQALEDYPGGLEVDVSPEALDEAGIRLGVDPDRIRAAYALVAEKGKVPESGRVLGSDLEDLAAQLQPAADGTVSYAADVVIGDVPMSDGEEPLAVFQKLAAPGGADEDADS